MAKQKQPDSFESAMSELEQIVRELETGQVSLEEMLAKYERGQQLREYCQEQLNVAEQRIQQIGGQGQQSNP